MSAGRPYNSKTPLWNNKAALKVRIYRWIEFSGGTKYGCAKVMHISRSTVIKWWDIMEWTPDLLTRYKRVKSWMGSNGFSTDAEACAKDLGISVDDAYLDIHTAQEMHPKYVM